jgi:ABC-type uncharacterized transport system YnjBCD permease subunit
MQAEVKQVVLCLALAVRGESWVGYIHVLFALCKARLCLACSWSRHRNKLLVLLARSAISDTARIFVVTSSEGICAGKSVVLHREPKLFCTL